MMKHNGQDSSKTNAYWRRGLALLLPNFLIQYLCQLLQRKQPHQEQQSDHDINISIAESSPALNQYISK
jgi:hypothetical protein